MSDPLFVVISDIHYNVKNLALCDKALRLAIEQAGILRVPLVIAGDLHDTKSILHASCVNALIETFAYANTLRVIPTVLPGNHCLVNNKSSEHSLNFLRPYAHIADTLELGPDFCSIPYRDSAEEFMQDLSVIPKGSIVIMHQGVRGADMGHYTSDDSAITTEHLKDYRCFSGHYHKHQTIGTLTYCGSPFTMTFGEASDGPKGYLIVNQDGTFNQVIVHFRRHLIFNFNASEVLSISSRAFVRRLDDLLWFKITDTSTNLAKVHKKDLAKWVGHDNFKLDKISTDVLLSREGTGKSLTEPELFDNLIDRTNEPAEKKKQLKGLWRDILK